MEKGILIGFLKDHLSLVSFAIGENQIGDAKGVFSNIANLSYDNHLPALGGFFSG